ncbi:hypothetical protein TNCV_3695541 [Trichonephila clavipes]|nr:hypothetical protein TNCV_3695541 [Trichonephila clavipes]
MPLDNKCRIGPLAGAPPDTCAVVIITETESGFITEDDTSPVCHTPTNFGQSSPLWFLLMALMSGNRDVLTLCDGTPTFCDPLLPTPSNYHIAPTEVAADTSIRPTCFSEAYYTAPIKALISVSCSYCRRLRLRGILSLNISKSSDSFG